MSILKTIISDDDNDKQLDDKTDSDEELSPNSLSSSINIVDVSPKQTPRTRRQSMRSISIQRALSEHAQNIQTVRDIRLKTISGDVHQSMDDIILFSTKTADDMETMCGCCNIYNSLYFISFYHLLMSIPLLCIGFIMFDIAIIAKEGVSDKLIIDDIHQLMVFIGYICFGLLRFFAFSLGIYLIPKFQYENLATLHNKLYKCYKRLVKIWLALLLLSPILYDILLIIEYIDDLKKENEIETTTKIDNSVICIFLLFLLELSISIYFFFIIHSFVSIKWPNH